MFGVDVKIVNWEEGGYTVDDRVGARGEILIGGDHVSMGYYNMPTKTEEDFYQEDGRQFFRTGDIGQVLKDGNIKIVDRKKDLVKLQLGEYVSLGKVESNMKIHPLVENLCVYGDSFHTATIALVVPNAEKLKQIGTELGKQSKFIDGSIQQLCVDSTVLKYVQDQLINHAHSMKLQKFEIPKKFRLLHEEWTPESGLVTAAFKLKRKPIQVQFQSLLDEMYRELDSEGSAIDVNVIKQKTSKVTPM